MSQSLALVVSYRGTDYHGFQYQSPSIPTIQGDLQQALSRVADERVEVTCAGRTDTGVHATHQVVSFSTGVDRPLQAWIRGTNRYLSNDVAVTWAGEVGPDFSARFSAEYRRYFYLIDNQPIRSPMLSDGLTHEWRPLDHHLMARAARALVGEHDFTSFRAASCSARTAVRRISEIDVRRLGTLVVIDVTANAFLHHMVRNIAAVLIEIGAGKRPDSWAGDLLSRRDRSEGGATAAPNGLYLVDVGYPASFGLPAGPDLPHLYSILAT